ALWFGPITTSIVTPIICVFGVIGTAFGRGPFAQANLNDNLIHLQIFLAVFSIAGAVMPGLFTGKGKRTLPVSSLLLTWLLAAAVFQHLVNEQSETDARRFAAL